MDNNGRQITGMPLSSLTRYVVGVLALWGIFMVFAAGIDVELRIKYNVLRFAGDAALLMAPALLLPRRRRMAMLVPVAAIALFLMASQAYYVYWHDLLPLDLVFRPASWNGFVADSAGSLFGTTQWLISAITVIYGIATWLLGRKGNEPYRWRPRILWFCAAIAFYALTIAGRMWQNANYYRSIGEKPTFAIVLTEQYDVTSDSKRRLFDRNPILYIYNEFCEIGNSRTIELARDEEDFISDVVNEGIGRAAPITGNESRNLILIIVESLNSDIIGVNYSGRSVTPTLDSILADSTTFSALRVVPQVGVGGSSDGQMIYNTGLLPAFNSCTALTFGGCREFPSLAKSLAKADAKEYIIEDRSVWNHYVTSAAYGYSSLYDADSLSQMGISPDSIGMDRAVFTMALQLLPQLPQPFFAELVTLSMHYPYIDAGAPRRQWIDSIPELKTIERNYLQTTNYFDCELRHFLDGLKRAGLYENSVIILASDHDQTYKTESRNSTERHPIAFIALNAGVDGSVDHPVYQMDIYPTVLDIMGYRGTGYRGLGQSLLSPQYHMNDSIAAERRRASDLIIRSDYFRDKTQSEQ